MDFCLNVLMCWCTFYVKDKVNLIQQLLIQVCCKYYIFDDQGTVLYSQPLPNACPHQLLIISSIK